MKNIFCKILELENHQVLITKRFNPEVEENEIVQTTELDDMQISIAIGFRNSTSCIECFENYDKDKAEKFINLVVGLNIGNS